MKFTSILLLVVGASAISVAPQQLSQFPDQMNSKADDSFMAKVFEKYSTLGIDSKGAENGKRALLYQNAKWATRDIVMAWKNLSSSDAEALVEGKFDKAWHSIQTSDKKMMDVRSAYMLVRQITDNEFQNAGALAQKK